MASEVNAQKMLTFKGKENVTKTNSRDSILYALGLGYSKDPMNEKELPFTYELHENFKLVPTFASVFHKADLGPETLFSIPGLPQFNPMMLLHGEQRLELLRPIKNDTEYKSQVCIHDVQDKGKGMLLTFKVESSEILQEGKTELAFRNYISVFIRGLGGFGFKGQYKSFDLPKKPQRNPDVSKKVQTSPDQAIIYRLSGDYNPLHIDPAMAQLGGFDRPILHGMCFYGIACKTAIELFCDNDPTQVKIIQVRFTNVVFPGDTLEYQFWREGNVLIFAGQNLNTKKESIFGIIELNSTPKL